MRTSTLTTARTRSLLALLLAVMLPLGLLLTSAPAHAHDSLISSDPEDGATLEVAPEQITLTYSAEVLEVSPVVQISGEEGEEPVELDVVIDGPTVTAEITDPLPAGSHTVQWRVVSSDGHPIEGSFTFTVEGGPGAAGEPAAEVESQEAEQAEDAIDPAGQDSEVAEETPTEESVDGTGQQASTLPLLLGVIGVAVLGVALAAFFALRRR